MQITISGFLDKDAAPFATALWKLLLSAQKGPQGIPKELLEAKKAELEQERVSTNDALLSRTAIADEIG